MSDERARQGVTIHVSLAPEYAVVGLGGTIMLQYAEAVREQLRAVVLGGARRILVDLAGVREIDSRGLGALVSLVRLAQERGGAVRFFDASPDVYALFELTRLHRVLDFYPNQALAMSQPWRTLETEHGQTA
jgi:anti-sigma B factor antagonist